MDITGLSLTTITLFIPMVGLAILLFMNGETQKNNVKWVAFGTSIVAFAASILMWVNFDPSMADLQMVQRNTWAEVSIGESSVNISYFVGVDGISMLLVLLTTFIMPIAILSSFGSNIFEERGREKLYYIFLMLLEWAMIGVFVIHDLIIFYVFWEVTLVPMYFLIGIWGAEQRVYAAVKFFLYTMAGSILMLLAILYVGNTTGTFSTYSTADSVGIIETVQTYEGEGSYWDQQAIEVPEDAEDGVEAPNFLFSSVQSFLFLGFLIAFAIKVPIFPFHSWLPDAHVQAPTAGSVILAGVLLKMGTYGIVRFNLTMFPDASVAWAPTIAALGVIGIIYGAWVSYAQDNVKKLVAYSSVSHLGFVVLGIFALNAQGLQGATLQMVNHGISTGGLFLVVGLMYERWHTKEMADYGGIWKVMPAFGAISLVITLSSMGLPGLNGFIGEFTILMGSMGSSYLGFFFTLFGTLGVILAAVYLLKMFQNVFMGEHNNPLKDEEGYKLKWNEIAAFIPILIMIFWMGIQPIIFFNMLDVSVDKIVAVFIP
jgi:NADH-quinone oxidoreductase subunit M